MMRFVSPLVLIICMVMPRPGMADTYLISRAQVLRFLELEDAAAKLELPRVVSLVPGPPLAVLSKRQRERSVSLRLGCRVPRACLPFYVALQFIDVASAKTFSDTLEGAGETRIHPIDRGPRLVQRGSIARLEIDAGTARMELYVRCLASGGQGDLLRVLDVETRKSYRARVVDKDRLRWEP